MSIVKEKVSNKDGRDVILYSIDNHNGLKAKILNYGGVVRSLEYRGTDVVLGYEKLEDYFINKSYFGALIGRNSNRVENAEFELNGKKYSLNKNEGKHNLHGGVEGFARKIWECESYDSGKNCLVLTLRSPDGEEGFPGNMNVKVTYTLTEENSLRIHYEAVCDADTVINMTNHSYFNLNGHKKGDILSHTLKLNADFYTPNNNEVIPTGEILSVKGTPFDFTSEKTFGSVIESEHIQIKMFGGLDHNFALNGRGFRPVCEVCGDKSGIKMITYTNSPGMQIYTMNSCNKNENYKDGAEYSKYGGFCLETQSFPNGLKFSHFPSPVIKKGEKYDTITEYKFI